MPMNGDDGSPQQICIILSRDYYFRIAVDNNSEWFSPGGRTLKSFHPVLVCKDASVGHAIDPDIDQTIASLTGLTRSGCAA